MSLTSVPRALGKLEYRLLRGPSAFLQQTYLSRLAEDNPRRLFVERALGEADEFAGRLLGDDEIRSRGTKLKEKAALLAQARTLETGAEQRRAAAEDELESDKQAAENARKQAVQEQQQELADARRKEREEKEQARKDAEKLAAEKQSKADQKANQRLQAVDGTRKQHEEQLSQQERKAAEERKQKVQEAKAEEDKADAQRAKAERLDDLADAEKTDRQVNRRQANNA